MIHTVKLFREGGVEVVSSKCLNLIRTPGITLPKICGGKMRTCHSRGSLHEIGISIDNVTRQAQDSLSPSQICLT